MNPEVTEMILEAGGEDLRICYQCGTCTGSCPWGYLSGLGVRDMIRKAQFGLEGFEGEDLWKCVTCNTCVSRCPRGVEIIDVIRSMRSILVEMDQIPRPLRTVLNSLDQEGNPWTESREDRTKWIKGVDVKKITAETEYLLFTGCTPAYDARTQKVARSLVKVLQAAGVDFGILGTEASCCGDAAHKIGNPELFEELKEANQEAFEKYAVDKIICISPHCYKAFRDLYALDGVEVYHHSQFLAELIESGALKLRNLGGQKVTYHDPCYLGRHSDVYEPPRAVLNSIAGVELVEMNRIRERSLCCGGGGGGAWMETQAGDRFAELRINEALSTGAKTIATACPFCILMLEDGAKSLNKDEDIQIKDLAEIVEEAL
jgi:Fe-S oxidoreductase